MKGLILTSLIIGVLIAGGIGTSVIVNNNLNAKSDAERQRGDEDGQRQGTLAGEREGTRAGFQAGSRLSARDGNIDDGSSSNQSGFYFVYNPSYNEMQEILAASIDTTAKGIHDYAEANGVRVAYVRCPIARSAPEGMVYLYELVAFETVDKGLIIIEPWSYREVQVEAGQSYSELNNFPPPDYNDTISKVTFVW